MCNCVSMFTNSNMSMSPLCERQPLNEVSLMLPKYITTCMR